MSRLHVNGLPPEVTDKHLRDLFEQFGPVASAKIVCGLDGNSLGFGMVEMFHAEDLAEILTTKDKLAIGGKRPHIWQVSETIGEVIHAKRHGLHVEKCNGKWYVFQLDEGHLQWCREFAKEDDARHYYRQTTSHQTILPS